MRADCLDRLISRLVCVGDLRLCVRNNPFFHALDPELWRRSDPDSFHAFAKRAPARLHLEQARTKALGLKGLPCGGRCRDPIISVTSVLRPAASLMLVDSC